MSCGGHDSGELGGRSRSLGPGSGCSTAASLPTVGMLPVMLVMEAVRSRES